MCECVFISTGGLGLQLGECVAKGCPTDVSRQIISDRAEDLCMRVNGLK